MYFLRQDKSTWVTGGTLYIFQLTCSFLIYIFIYDHYFHPWKSSDTCRGFLQIFFSSNLAFKAHGLKGQAGLDSSISFDQFLCST